MQRALALAIMLCMPDARAFVLDGTTTPTIINHYYQFSDGDSALGLVYFRKGFNVPAGGTVALDVYAPVDGPVNLNGTGTLHLTSANALVLGLNSQGFPTGGIITNDTAQASTIILENDVPLGGQLTFSNCAATIKLQQNTLALLDEPGARGSFLLTSLGVPLRLLNGVVQGVQDFSTGYAPRIRARGNDFGAPQVWLEDTTCLLEPETTMTATGYALYAASGHSFFKTVGKALVDVRGGCSIVREAGLHLGSGITMAHFGGFDTTHNNTLELENASLSITGTGLQVFHGSGSCVFLVKGSSSIVGGDDGITVQCFWRPGLCISAGTHLSLENIRYLSFSPPVLQMQTSSIDLAEGATYIPGDHPFFGWNGTLRVPFDCSVDASGSMFFRDGIYAENGSDLLLTATLDATQTYSIRLNGACSLRAQVDAPTHLRAFVLGSNNRIEGRPQFLTPNAVQLANSDAELILGTEGIFGQSIIMNGGSLVLENDFSIGQSNVLSGTGSVTLNGNNFIFGANDSVWTSTLYWTNAKNIVLGGDARLTGQWAFSGDASVVGGNNVLDITRTGTIRIKANTTVELNNLTLNGLGTGTIVFDDSTGVLSLKNCVVKMDRSYTVTSGLWSVDAPTKVVTADKILYFASSDQLAVAEGASLDYDTLGNNDNKNIFIINSDNPLADSGLIRNVTTLPGADFNYTGNSTLSAGLVVTPLRRLFFLSDTVLDGAGFSIQFARNPGIPILLSSPDTHITFQNISLKDFPVTIADVRLRSGSTLTLGHQATVELGDSATLTSTWYCSGAAVIHGNGKVLTLGTGGNIVLRPGASLLFDNITLNDVHGYNICCMDDRCTVTFGNVLLVQDGDYSFTRGKIYVRDELDLTGSATFKYASQKTSTIGSFGKLLVDRGMTFKYAPPVADKTLIQFADNTAVLELHGGTLATTTTGMQLTKGTLLVSSASTLQNQGALSSSQAVIFGDGNPSHDMILDVQPGKVLDTQSGIVFFQQT